MEVGVAFFAVGPRSRASCSPVKKIDGTRLFGYPFDDLPEWLLMPILTKRANVICRHLAVRTKVKRPDFPYKVS
jgi:hypothetical protein